MSTSTGSGPNYLYNGNISSMAVNIGVLGQGQLNTYGYDQLNRLVSVDVQRAAANWSSFSATQDYREQISYDANGNIQTYLRNGTAAGGKPLAMDNLTYGYNTDASGNKLNNQLRQVRDAVTSNYTEDIDDQPAGNYRYDAIGNLVADSAERISQIDCSVYGKILSITKRNPAVGEVERISYTYDASGNRISKFVETRQRPDQHTWYVRDAQGNVLAVYTRSGNNAQSPLLLSESHLYGSSRLGLVQRSVNMGQPASTTEAIPLLGSGKGDNFMRGQKLFELSNHLGNVLATVTDRKTGIDANTDGLIDHYTADVSTAQDYYAFGMQMPGRKFSVGSYRYGYQGSEKYNELKGDGNSYTTEFRQYDPRLGRWLSIDPKEKIRSWQSPYCAIDNSPIWKNDPKGDVAPIVVWMLKKAGEAAIGVATDIAVQLAAEYYFGGHNSWGQAWDALDIDWWQATSSGGEALIKNKHLAAAFSAANDMTNYLKTEDNATWEGAMMRGGLGLASGYIGGNLGHYINKYGFEKFSKGLSRMMGESGALKAAWKLSNFERGKVIEGVLWGSKYKSFGWVGKLKNGFFPTIDFYSKGLGVQFKSFSGKSVNFTDYKKTIDGLIEARGTVIDGRRINQVRLDIGVESADQIKKLDKVKEYAEGRGLDIRIFVAGQ